LPLTATQGAARWKVIFKLGKGAASSIFLDGRLGDGLFARLHDNGSREILKPSFSGTLKHFRLELVA
jgi:hypothetical protein